MICDTLLVPLRALDFLVVELDETKLCIVLVGIIRVPDPFGMRLKTRTRRSSRLIRGHLEGLCFLEPLMGLSMLIWRQS